MRARLISIIFFFVGIYLIVSFSHDLWNLIKKGNEMGKANLSLEKLRVENAEFKKRLDEVQSPTFVEKEARDKLGLSRPNETILVLPEKLTEIDRNVTVDESESKLPPWKQWWGLFFGK